MIKKALALISILVLVVGMMIVGTAGSASARTHTQHRTAGHGSHIVGHHNGNCEESGCGGGGGGDCEEEGCGGGGGGEGGGGGGHCDESGCTDDGGGGCDEDGCEGGGGGGGGCTEDGCDAHTTRSH